MKKRKASELNDNIELQNLSLDDKEQKEDKDTMIDSYNTYYDDSSSEEDFQELDRQGIEEFKEKAECLVEEKAQDNENDMEFSFLAHEFGVRLLKSKEVTEHYLLLKKDLLGNNTVLPKDIVNECLMRALKTAFKIIFPQLKWRDHETTLRTVCNNIVKDQRSLFKGFGKNKIPLHVEEELRKLLSNELYDRGTYSINDIHAREKLVHDVYKESGVILGDIKKQIGAVNLIYNKMAKIYLKKATFSSSLKANIRDHLLSISSTMKVNAFVRANSHYLLTCPKKMFL